MRKKPVLKMCLKCVHRDNEICKLRGGVLYEGSEPFCAYFKEEKVDECIEPVKSKRNKKGELG